MHTNAPWTFKQASGKIYATIGGNGKLIAVIKNKISDEDGRRIVAAVNACEGIQTDYLAAMGGMTILAKANAQADTVNQQRDELLAALKNIVNLIDSGEGIKTVRNGRSLQLARAAIDKAERNNE